MYQQTITGTCIESFQEQLPIHKCNQIMA